MKKLASQLLREEIDHVEEAALLGVTITKNIQLSITFKNDNIQIR